MPVPVKVIFDTDMGCGHCVDVDDVGTLCMLNALADLGEIEVCACASSANATTERDSDNQTLIHSLSARRSCWPLSSTPCLNPQPVRCL